MARYTINVTLNNHILTVNSMRQKAFTRRADEIVWHCPHAQMQVDFKGPTPFTWSSQNIPSGSNNPHRVVNPVGISAYKLTIYHADYTVVIDPEVDADGGDPGGMKKAAKKASRKKASRKSASKPSKKARKK